MSRAPEKRTYLACIAVLNTVAGPRAVVTTPGRRVPSGLPLTDATVTLRPKGLFMATGAHGESGYFGNLETAVLFTERHGSAGTPGAITILAPAPVGDQLSHFDVVQVHVRATAAPCSRDF